MTIDSDGATIGAGERTRLAERVEAMTTVALTRAGRVAIELGRQLETVFATRDESVLADPPRRWWGQGPVVLVGGYATTDPVLAPMAGWLDHLGYDVVAFTTGSGIGCADRAADALATRLREVAAAAGGAPVRLVGHSRGGQFARVAAGRVHDDVNVDGLVTLGTPFDPIGGRWPVLAHVSAAAVAGSLGVPGLLTWGCLYGRCCAQYRKETRAPWPVEVPFTSIYSRRDAAVPTSSSIDPHAHNVEIDGGHLSLLTSPAAFAATADALAAGAASHVSKRAA